MAGNAPPKQRALAGTLNERQRRLLAAAETLIAGKSLGCHDTWLDPGEIQIQGFGVNQVSRPPPRPVALAGLSTLARAPEPTAEARRGRPQPELVARFTDPEVLGGRVDRVGHVAATSRRSAEASPRRGCHALCP